MPMFCFDFFYQSLPAIMQISIESLPFYYSSISWEGACSVFTVRWKYKSLDMEFSAMAICNWCRQATTLSKFLKNKPKSHSYCDFVFISFSWQWADWSLFCSSLYSTIPRASQGIIVHIWSTKATRAIFLNIQSLTVFNSFCDGNN